MSFSFFHDLFDILCPDWLFKNIEFPCVKNYDLVRFSNKENLILLHILAEGDLTFIHREGIWLYPLALDDDLPTDILVDFAKSQEVYFITKGVDKNELVAVDEARGGFYMGFTPGNCIDGDVFMVADVIYGDKVVHSHPEMIYFEDINPVNSADTDETAIPVVVVFPEVELEDARNFCDLSDRVFQRTDYFFGQFTTQSREQALLDPVHIQFSALSCKDHDAFKSFGGVENLHEYYFFYAEVLQHFYEFKLHAIYLQSKILEGDHQMGGAVGKSGRPSNIYECLIDEKPVSAFAHHAEILFMTYHAIYALVGKLAPDFVIDFVRFVMF